MIGTHATMRTGLAGDLRRRLIDRPIESVRAYMDRKAAEELAEMSGTAYDRRRAAETGRVATEIAMRPDRSVRSI